MKIGAQCPFCGKGWLLDEAAADCRVRCPDCHKLFKLPRLDEIPKATKIAKQAKGSLYVDEDGKTYG